MNEFIINALFAALACFGFANLNQTPKRVIFYSAFLGGLGHTIRNILMINESFSVALASLIASFCIGLFAVAIARKASSPIEVIAFPALLPMVPGMYAYKSILAVFSFLKSGDESVKIHHLIEFFNNLFITISVALALAVGVSIVLLMFFEKSFTMTRNANLFEIYKDKLKD
ncbi:MAG: threonine/serine exporter family protein [Campylobacter sp.]|nr:threonine/serine exporter family protein [Campylobacter sp.]